MTTTKARRPKGAGTVRNRGTDRHPRWFAQYGVMVDGKRRQRTQGPFRRKAEAEEWLRGELRRQREGTEVLPSRLTVGEVLDDWLDTVSHGLSPSTVPKYRSIIDARLKPHLGHIKVQELRTGHISRAYNALRRPGANRRTPEKGLSETSVRRTHEVLHSALEWAVNSQHYLVHNPAADVEKPKADEVEIAVWDASQLGAFLDHASSDRLLPLWRTLAYTGLRPSEALGLRWSEVDLDASVLRVVRRRLRVGYSMTEVAGTKTPKGRRPIDLDERTVVILRRRQTKQKEERLAWPAWVDTGLVFTQENGEGLILDHVQQRFARLVREAGVPSIRLYDLRHSHASLLLKAGVPVKVVSERLGHASPAFTLSVYQHLLPGMQAEAAARFAAMVDG